MLLSGIYMIFLTGVRRQSWKYILNNLLLLKWWPQWKFLWTRAKVVKSPKNTAYLQVRMRWRPAPTSSLMLSSLALINISILWKRNLFCWSSQKGDEAYNSWNNNDKNNSVAVFDRWKTKLLQFNWSYEQWLQKTFLGAGRW